MRRSRLVAILFLAACGGSARAPEFVGSAACAGCHTVEAERWKGSHHALAMQAVGDPAVLGDWNDVSFADTVVTARFFRDQGVAQIATAGPDGATTTFAPAYTFGLYPLQQVLLPLPRGRLQAFTVAWDARPKAVGGQRWYDLYGAGAGAPLHWTSRDLTWNHQCAECHSTDVRKGYSAVADSYATTFKEVNVGCEACHGPGGTHVRSAAGRRPGSGGGPVGGLPADLDYDTTAWVFGPGDSIAHRATPRAGRREVESCGRCHARRGVTEEGFAYGKPLLASHRPALLDEGLYWPDGQIRDEVYEYGSFLSSRMSRAGVTCADCHDPHSAARPVDNSTCAKCHLTATFDVPRHTRHPVASAGSRCVSCHMPSKTYMGVDVRHDHSFRIPRPELTTAIGVPNACTQCHAERGAGWAADRIAGWTGRRRSPTDHYGATFARADLGDPESREPLLAIAEDVTLPVMVRASAYARLGRFPTLPLRAALATAATDPDPLIRAGVVQALQGFRPIDRLDAGLLLLADSVRTIRIDAARALADARDQIPAPQRELLDRAISEWVTAQRLNDDRADARVTLADYYAATGKGIEAEQEYRAAIRLDPEYAPAYVNLADLFRAAGREADAVTTLREGLQQVPRDATLHHTLGLTLIRQRQLMSAVAEFARAVELAPEDARFAYVLAVALHDVGQEGEAMRIIIAALRQHPYDRDMLEARNAWSPARP